MSLENQATWPGLFGFSLNIFLATRTPSVTEMKNHSIIDVYGHLTKKVTCIYVSGIVIQSVVTYTGGTPNLHDSMQGCHTFRNSVSSAVRVRIYCLRMFVIVEV